VVGVVRDRTKTRRGCRRWAKQADGSAGEGLEVVDVAQMLLAAVRRGDPAGEPASV
jgi:hypothetical protein